MTEAIKTAEKISSLSKIAVQLAKEAVNTGMLLFKQFMIPKHGFAENQDSFLKD